MTISYNFRNIHNDNNRREIVRFPFKLAHTNQTMIYEIPTNITIANFVEYIKARAYRDFNVNPENRIEIVDSHQCLPNISDEDALPILISHNITIREKYHGTYDGCAFYIRVINREIRTNPLNNFVG